MAGALTCLCLLAVIFCRLKTHMHSRCCHVQPCCFHKREPGLLGVLTAVQAALASVQSSKCISSALMGAIVALPGLWVRGAQSSAPALPFIGYHVVEFVSGLWGIEVVVGAAADSL